MALVQFRLPLFQFFLTFNKYKDESNFQMNNFNKSLQENYNQGYTISNYLILIPDYNWHGLECQVPRYNIKQQHFISKATLMSRCQHGEPITLFCVSETCNWRQAGGCQNCLKKYHTHLQNIDTISLEKVQDLAKMFNVHSDIKTKSKILQQAVYNYFIVMKSQLSTSIDAVSRSITNKLSFPYLCSEGQLTTFRKIRNKEYKKISKKQLKSFYSFANSQNKDLIQFNQKKLYTEEVKELGYVMKSINESFLAYSKAIEKLDNSFNIERSFYNKILEFSANLGEASEKQQRYKTETHQKDGKKRATEPQENSKVQPKPPGRDRKVSIDHGIGLGIDINKFKTATGNQNFDENQKQIYERKKKLFEMLNPNKNNDSLQKASEIAQVISKQTINTTSVDKQAKKQPLVEHNHVHLAQQRQIPSSISQNSEQQPSPEVKTKIDNKKQAQQETIEQIKFDESKIEKENINIFEDLLSKGINLPEMIMHTILPREASKQKLYEDTKDVKQRKITIPVKNFAEKEENQSPLLKVKRQKNRQTKEAVGSNQKNQGQMNQINLFGDKSQKDEDKTLQTPKKDKEEEENLMLKDREADSLALLLQSLPLPAERAIPLLEAAIKFSYNNLSAAQYLSYLYLQIEKPKQCLQLCNKILEQLQDSPQANELSIHISNNKAAALNMLGRYSESIGILQKCLAYTKRDIYYKNLGDAYFSIAIYEKACMNYESAIKLNNHMEEAYYNLAVCYFIQEHLHEAQLNVSKALKINPRNEDYLKLSRELMIKMQI